MKLIVGLGNPGAKYANTRHNLGFMVLDALDLIFKSDHHAEVAQDNQITYIKPQTFMNLSGQAVQYWMQQLKIKPADLWVVHDDIDLEFGKLRIRSGGSSGGHNGLKSIIEAVGADFIRFKIGVANAELRTEIDPEVFVLQRFSAPEQQTLSAIVEKTAAQVLSHLEDKEILDHTHSLI